MNTHWKAGFSLVALPLLGVCALSFCLAHPSLRAQTMTQAAAPSQMLLITPDPRMNRCFAIFLRQQYQNVQQERKRGTGDRLRRAVADYNLLAAESDSGVFVATHLPSAL